MADTPTQGRRALNRIAVLGGILVLLVLTGAGALLGFSVNAVDRLQAHEERLVVKRALERFQERLVGDLTTATVWDQAYKTLRPGGDLAWADAEIGSYYANNRGHALTAVIDENGRPFYAWADQARTEPHALDRFLKDAAPLVAQVRERERTTRPPVDLEPTDPGLALTASGIVMSGGRYYLVGASTVTPEHAGAPRRPGPAVMVISGRRLDSLLQAFNHDLQVEDTGIVKSPHDHDNRLELVDVNGRDVGAVAWHAKRPGLAALRGVIPVVAVALMMLTVLLAVLAVHIRSIARGLDTHERGRRDAMADLTRARDEAEAANRSKSQFLANMSHEIRTPLNGILGMVQVMERGRLGSPHAERLEIIKDCGESLLSVLNGILDLSKIEAGLVDLEVREFDLAEEVMAACKPFANLAFQKFLSFDVDIDSKVRGEWLGDAMRIRQVLSNLASNAVKFTSQGGVKVEVRRTAEGVTVAVSDTGIGVPKERVSELFEKFVQADASTTRRFGGTGLGLAICRELVTMMGGQLAVTTAEGQGSTFRFDLPLARAQAAAA